MVRAVHSALVAQEVAGHTERLSGSPVFRCGLWGLPPGLAKGECA